MKPGQTGAIVFSWTGAVPGREAKGLEVFTKANQYYEGLEKAGRIHGTTIFLPITGGCAQYIVEGELTSLLQLLTDEEFLAIQQEASLTTMNFEMNICVGGPPDSLNERVEHYMETLQTQELV